MINNQLAVKGGMCCMSVGSKAKMDFMLRSKRVSAHYSLGHRRHCIWDKIGKEHEGVTLIFFFLSLSFCTKLVSLAYIYVTSRSPSSVAWRGKKRLGGRLIFLGHNLLLPGSECLYCIPLIPEFGYQVSWTNILDCSTIYEYNQSSVT